jgi:hypothetical protein
MSIRRDGRPYTIADPRAAPAPASTHERREIGAEFTWQTVQHPFWADEDGLLLYVGGVPLTV